VTAITKCSFVGAAAEGGAPAGASRKAVREDDLLRRTQWLVQITGSGRGHQPVAGAGLLDVAEPREREVIAGDQKLVGDAMS